MAPKSAARYAPCTCEPSPITNRPPVEPARSQPTSAVAIGVRAKRDRDPGMQFDPLGGDAGDGQREKRIVLVLHRDDAVIPLGLDPPGLCRDPAQIVLRHRREHAHAGAPFRDGAIGP